MLHVDRYTKCVLTVIAGCLLWICVRGMPAATAYGDSRSSVQDVRVVAIQKPSSSQDWATLNVYDVSPK